MVVITLSARLCLVLVRAPYLSLRSVVGITYLPSGVISSLMWFMPRLQRSCMQLVALMSGYWSGVPLVILVSQGRSGTNTVGHYLCGL